MNTHGVLRVVVACCATGVVCATSACAGPLADYYSIHEGGQERHFQIARDELFRWKPASSLLQLNPVDTAEAAHSRAEALRKQSGSDLALVLYDRGVPRSDFSRRILTRYVIAHLAPEADSALMATTSGALGHAGVPGLKGWVRFEAPDPDGALNLAARMRCVPGVLYAEVQLAKQHQAKLVPNDALFPQQWHLGNTGQNGGAPGIDIGVQPVWDRWRGSGITIGVVDTGVQSSHPDLASNLNSALGLNLNASSFAPAFDYHGTAVSGVAAARGNNGIGVTGVAFEAALADIRLLADSTTDEQDASAMLHADEFIHIKNNSWGAADGTGALDGAGPLMAEALAQGTTSGRDGRGTVFVFAGGNGLAYGEDVNYDGYANSPFVTAVGAINDVGEQTIYSEPGACLVVCAPSSSGPKFCAGGHQGLTTTDALGDDGYNSSGAYCELPDSDYTQSFRGTSGAAPIVSGVVALMLQANPSLGWRDVKEILLRSARKVEPQDPDWHTNSAGIAHNYRFGAGLVSAAGAITLATNWLNLRPLCVVSLLQTNLGVPVPDNTPVGIERLFAVTNAGFRVETIALTVTLPHNRYGDLAITLTSPAGTVSRLAEPHTSYGTGYGGWTFTSVRHWGEQAQGQWKVNIADRTAGFTGTLQDLRLELLGSVPMAILSLTLTNAEPCLTLTSAAPGWRYILESSTNLLQWSPIATMEIDFAGTCRFSDARTITSAAYYRAALAPEGTVNAAGAGRRPW